MTGLLHLVGSGGQWHHPIASQLLGLVEQLVGTLDQGVCRLLRDVFPTPNEAVM